MSEVGRPKTEAKVHTSIHDFCLDNRKNHIVTSGQTNLNIISDFKPEGLVLL